MPRILLIDDDPAYCLQLKGAALQSGFEVVFFHNLEDGMEALKETRRLKAVILYGHCFLEPQQEGSAHSNFVFHGLQQLADIEHQYNRVIPFCFNSENPEDFREDLVGITKVFEKQHEHDQMFCWLNEAIEELPETTIRKRYADVFELLEAMHPRLLPAELFLQATCMYMTCSKYGNHFHRKNARGSIFLPRKYTLPRLVFTFLEFASFIFNDQLNNNNFV